MSNVISHKTSSTKTRNSLDNAWSINSKNHCTLLAAEASFHSEINNYWCLNCQSHSISTGGSVGGGIVCLTILAPCRSLLPPYTKTHGCFCIYHLPSPPHIHTVEMGLQWQGAQPALSSLAIRYISC